MIPGAVRSAGRVTDSCAGSMRPTRPGACCCFAIPKSSSFVVNARDVPPVGTRKMFPGLRSR